MNIDGRLKFLGFTYLFIYYSELLLVLFYIHNNLLCIIIINIYFLL